MSTSGDFESEANNSVGNASFWDLKQYAKSVKRVENANKLCTDLCNMIQDRVEIEKTYSSSLRKWSQKWMLYLETGLEYGTTKQTWMGFCKEADAISELHKDIRTQLIDEVQNEIRNWQREHYHKATLPPQHLKEAKSLDADFDAAQKPWAKKLKKVNQSKKDFHQQCKMTRSYEVQSKNAINDSNMSQDQVKKIEEKLRKAEKDSDKLKLVYESSLEELNGDSVRYIDEMTKVFNKSQTMEKDRMAFFKSIFLKIQKILNLSENRSLSDIYNAFEKTIKMLDTDSDTIFWAQMNGSEMPFNIPQFEEYTQELHSITKKKLTLSNDTGVTLTAVNIASRQGSIRSGDTASRASLGRSATSPTGTEASNSSQNLEPSTPGSNMRESPDIDEEGTQVRALYDYNGVEDDELTLKQGDIFLKLEDEDEQGWCKGRKDDRIGLYPANYAEAI